MNSLNIASLQSQSSIESCLFLLGASSTNEHLLLLLLLDHMKTKEMMRSRITSSWITFPSLGSKDQGSVIGFKNHLK